MLTLGPPPTAEPPQGVIVTQDLVYGSQVTQTAAAHGLRFVMAMSREALQVHLTAGTIRGVILDLNCAIAPCDIVALLPEPKPRTVAFGPHVHVAALQAARDAGFEDVMPRSKFSATLPELLRGLVSPSSD